MSQHVTFLNVSSHSTEFQQAKYKKDNTESRNRPVVSNMKFTSKKCLKKKAVNLTRKNNNNNLGNN